MVLIEVWLLLVLHILCFLVFTLERALEVRSSWGRRLALLELHHSVIVLVVLVNLINITFKLFYLCDLLKDLITAVAVLGEEDELVEGFSSKHLLEYRQVPRTILRIVHFELPLKDLNELKGVRTFIEDVYELFLELSLIIDVFFL